MVRFVAILAALLAGGTAHAQSQCTNPANAIVAENCLAGNSSSEWDVGPGQVGDLTIQGFADNISVNRGSTINFKIDTPASAYTITIYRIGYYAGNGARKITTITPSAKLPQKQPSCLLDANTGLEDCGNWAVSASWQVPSTATSGVYFAHLIRSDTGGDSHIVFIVRNDASTSNIIYQTADESWQAYNYYGAGSLYSQAQPLWDLTDRSYKVSYNRPFLTRGFNQEWDTWIFGSEFAMIQWMESNGYDVTYSTGVDSDRSGATILNHKIFMDAGHDEYWTAGQRANVQAARDAGVNLAFFSGNTMFWKTRWENSIDGTNTANRTLVGYKETLAFAKIDPSDPPTWTGTWRDPSFSPPADGGNPENSLVGTLFMVNGTGPDNDGSQQIQVPAADGKMRFWRNTAVANQSPGATYKLPVGTLGYEWDPDVDNGYRPAGAFDLSTATYTLTSDYLLDYGATYGAGTATHHLMMYRAPSGALVFSAGSIDWAWGLNSNHDNIFDFNTPAPDVNMQQAMVNLFADMGVQPTTLQPGLVAATKSTDTTPPVSSITVPAKNATLNTGTAVTVTGTATDSGGGVVAGVEFSSDGGKTWHPATGRSSWTYAWTPTVLGSSTTLMSRAVDDSGNIEKAPGGTVVNVVPQTCPCTIWNSSAAPATPDSDDPTGIEVGLKFRADSDGSVLGVRFYKSAANTGTHIGHVWTDSGTLLGTATFTGETSSGWQQVNFSSPVAVTANTTYVVSYYAPKGHYAADAYYLAKAGVDNPPLHALQDGVDGGNGVYYYPSSGTTGGFPASTNNSENFWVDVLYTSSSTYAISGTISGPGGTAASVTLTGPENFTTISDSSGNYNFDGVVNGTYTVAVSNPGVTFTPPTQNVTVSNTSISGVNFASVISNPLSISGNISGAAGAVVILGGGASASTTADASGNYSFPDLLNGSYTVTPNKSGYLFTPGSQSVVLSGSSTPNVNFVAQQCNCVSLWLPSATPALIDSSDTNGVEVGIRFQTSSPGILTGLKFYKAAANTGVHVGHIWSSTGTLLGSATFSGETASGWQNVNFSNPITLAANTTYIASYYAPSGHYSADINYFATATVSSPPLQAPANTANAPNGLYAYTTSGSGAFPSSTYSSTNYWVDVIFAGSQSYTLSGTVAGAPGATVALSGSSTATTTADASGNYTFNVYPGAYTVTPSLSQFAFNPGSQNVVVGSGSVSGVNFSVPSICPCDTIWAPSTLPGTVDSGDTLPYELGVKFTADSDGYILGVRFYKGSANTGTHTAHLWSTNGNSNPLSAATFSNENATGWQQVMFANPVPVSTNTTYIASYFAPAGHYSANSGYFTGTGVDNPPLHALASGVNGPNGVYSQTATSTLPASSYQDSNYWVDVIYATTGQYSVGGLITGPGSAGATVTLSGATSAKTVADAYGNYSFGGLANGTYTVTPTQSGYSFAPASQTVTISGAHNLSVNFVSGVPTYVVSGTVAGAPGITVALSGPTTASVTADASGNYSFPAVQNGNYTVTPSGPGYQISPTNQAITVNGANLTAVNFSATSLTYSITGTITGGAGSTVYLTGAATATATADGSGNYSFSALTNGSYTVTPAKAGLVFSPTTLSAAVVGANVAGANFSVPQTCPCDTLWQPTAVPTTVDDMDSNSTEVGVTLQSTAPGLIAGIRFYKSASNTGTHIANLWSSTGTLLASAAFTAESSSGWQQVFFTNPVPIAANTAYVASYFAPVGHYSGDSNFFASAGVNSPPLQALQNSVTSPNGIYSYGANSTFPTNTDNAANYWVDVIYEPAYTVSGTISGAAGAGATVTMAGPVTLTTTADGSGNYTFASVPNGSYTVTPTASAATFAPATQTVVVSGANVTVPAFAASAGTYTVSGTITGAGGNGATVALSGASMATTTASSSGAYSFTGLVNGAYTVTPANSGYTFNPTSQAVTVKGANLTVPAFATAVQTYTLSGTITGAGGSGATVSLGGSATATTTASSTGAYSFTALSNGSYVVTPTSSGYNFTPASQSATISGANVTVPAFVTAASTYTISGTISGPGASGATVNLTGTSTATTTASSTGAYSFTGLANGSYTVAPTNFGYNFTPASQAVSVSGANATVAAFTSTAQTYTVSGTISGAGGSGATVTLTGAATTTTTASSTGAFSFTGLANGSYTITPTKSGYTFAPTSQGITVSGANVTLPAFTATALTYTISGTLSGAGGVGATVTLSGASTAMTTATSTGTYSFTGLANGSYTVTPANAGYTFTPTSRAVTVSGANATVPAFTATAVTYTISGTISGTGGSGATVSLTGTSTATTTASSTGTYSFTGLANGSYTVTPTNTGYTFSPTSQMLSVNGTNVTVPAFTATAPTYIISGTISGTGGSGATVNLTGSSTASTTATSTGAYSFTVPNGSYTIAPVHAGYSFAPTTQAVTVSNANATIPAFTATAATYTISGTISGTGGSGATVSLTGSSTASTTASSTGAYSFTGLANGSYTVTPTNAGYSFAPTSQAVTVNGANATVPTFTATSATYTISGTISGTGGSGATVKLTGTSTASVTASSTGAYSFTGLANGSYTVTPTNAGYSFAPTSQAVTVSGASATVPVFTATALTYTISGTISGTGGNGAKVSLTGSSTATATASSTGTYSFTGLPNGSYTVTPTNSGYTFSPTNQAITISGASKTANFTATGAFTITGAITGAGGSGATVKLTGSATASTTATSSGTYTFTGIANGSYTVTPTQSGYSFSPTSQATTVNGASSTVPTFTATALTYSISGTISGAGGNGATVSLTGASTATTTASSTGTYSFTGLGAGSYTVTPTNSGFVLTPVNRAVTISSASKTANFTATGAFTISGVISGPGGSGAKVKLSGNETASTTASTSGAYSLTGVANGSYTVTPTNSGYTFSPTAQAVTISGASGTANFSSSVTTYTLSGVISGAGGNGATVTLGGTSSATTTASSSGAYSFTVTTGSYTLTPRKSGYTFTPTSRSPSIGTSSKTENFSSTAN